MIELENLPVDITEHIKKFRDFLNVSWPSLDDLMENHDWDNDVDFIMDWLQINWELLVERELLEKQGFLLPFAGTILKQRFTFPQQIPQYLVIAKSDKQIFDIRYHQKLLPNDQQLRLLYFCTYKDRGVGLYPPFDLVNLIVDSTKELFIVPFDDVKFYLDVIKPPLCS